MKMCMKIYMTEIELEVLMCNICPTNCGLIQQEKATNSIHAWPKNIY